MTRTKLIVTVGPACESESILSEMIAAGVNVFRLNFSHGTLDTHEATLARIRRLTVERGNTTVAVLGDLCGPKIRLGRIKGGKCMIETGQEVIFQRHQIEGTAQRLWSNYPALVDDVLTDHRVLIDDGSVRLRALARRTDELVCICEVGGPVSDHKGINLPDSKVSAPSLTDKDRTCLDWAIRHELDWIALSFVRHPDDLRQLRTILQEQQSQIRIIAKIEKPEALQHLNEIISLSDGVMVARGDLGVEMDLARVPIVQKEIVLLCQRDGKPAIIATQMLQSMVESPFPTRAEVSDVANAILDRADAIMLSAETSVGKYPVQAVRQALEIADQTDSFGLQYGDELGTNRMTHLPVATALVRGVSMVARELKPPAVAVWSPTGDTAILLSKHRIARPIIALSPNPQVCRQMAMLYGTIPLLSPVTDDIRTIVTFLDRWLLDRGLVRSNDQILVVADTRPDIPGETDAMFIHCVGSIQAVGQ